MFDFPLCILKYNSYIYQRKLPIMKVSFILLTALFYTVHAKAQQNNIFKNKPWEDFRKKELLNQKLKQMNPAINNDKSSQPLPLEQNNKGVLKIPLTATYEGNNGKGADLYAMQPYDMPCIVPDKTFNSAMPIAGKYGKDFVSPFKKSPEETEGKK